MTMQKRVLLCVVSEKDKIIVNRHKSNDSDEEYIHTTFHLSFQLWISDTQSILRGFWLRVRRDSFEEWINVHLEKFEQKCIWQTVVIEKWFLAKFATLFLFLFWHTNMDKCSNNTIMIALKDLGTYTESHFNRLDYFIDVSTPITNSQNREWARTINWG